MDDKLTTEIGSKQNFSPLLESLCAIFNEDKFSPLIDQTLLGGQVIDSSITNLLVLLNSNYFEKSTCHANNHTVVTQEDEAGKNIWIVYQVTNCLIKKPIGLIAGSVTFAKQENCECKIFPNSNVVSNPTGAISIRPSDVIALSYNESNSFHRSDMRCLIENRSRFKIEIHNDCSLTFITKLGQILIHLQANSSMTIGMNKFILKNNQFEDEFCVMSKSNLKESIIHVNQGNMQLFIDESEFAFLGGAEKQSNFTIEWPNQSSEITFLSKNISMTKWKRVISSPPTTPIFSTQLKEIESDEINVLTNKSPSFIRINSSPQILGFSNFKQQSIATFPDNEGQQANESFEIDETSKQSDENSHTIPDGVVNSNKCSEENNEHVLSKECISSLPCSDNNEKQSSQLSKKNKQYFSNTLNTKSDQTSQKQEIPTKRMPLNKKENKPTSGPRKEPEDGKDLSEPQMNNLHQIYDLGQVKNVLHSNSPVNKEPSSKLSNSARSKDFYLNEQQDLNRNSVQKKLSTNDHDMVASTEHVSNQMQQSKCSTLKKKAIHEMHKAHQYIKFINNHLRNNTHSSGNLKVKGAFDKYGIKLRKQLVKTIDAVELHIKELDFEQNDSTQTDTITSSDYSFSVDQDFFYDIIGKMRSLMTNLNLNLFQLICQEIETCLIEIDKKFFA